MRIVGLCGSLRAASYNRGLLRAAAASLPAGVTLDVVEIGALPLMNGDLEKPAWPAAVVAFRRALWAPMRYCSRRPNRTPASRRR